MNTNQFHMVNSESYRDRDRDRETGCLPIHPTRQACIFEKELK
jgi:hypothetical protein